MPHSDTRFFTNTENSSLVTRFAATLKEARFFDVLVGYFRASGFHLLCHSLQDVEKIRILVGLNVDEQIFSASQDAMLPLPGNLLSHQEARNLYSRQLVQEIESAEETQATEESIRIFMQWLQQGKLELRGHPSRTIHAKVYISRYRGDLLYGSVITGSSNFSTSGLMAQCEFNVELKDRPDVDFALERFEKLWQEGIALTDIFVATVQQKTWLSESITPYELYLKVLYEYFREDMDLAASASLVLPEGMYNLEYQRQAVAAAARILSKHNGVFLSDVVGLGKTYITALLLQTLPGKKLIICPPVLCDYWRDTLMQFMVPHCRVVSSGKLDVASAKASQCQIVVVDEAHRFRNENTQSYAQLKVICANKKVILLSATPLNNQLGDLLAQLKLFQAARQSSIQGVSNLEGFFKKRQEELKSVPRDDPSYPDIVRKSAALVRDKVLKYVMVRRTRSEIRRYFQADLQRQQLHFPEMMPPQRIIYKFDAETEVVFDETIALLKTLQYARYKALLYLERGISAQQRQGQHNISGFMKCILIKRLESSFQAFRGTVSRFIQSHETFLKMLAAGCVILGKNVDVEAFAGLDDDALTQALDAADGERYDAAEFSDELRKDVEQDLEVLRSIARLWTAVTTDSKFEAVAAMLQTSPLLKDERVLIFTESRETALYLGERLEVLFPGASLVFDSQGGVCFRDGARQFLSSYDARERILRNFDPGHEAPEQDIRLLIATDVLAEGVNLHRAGRIINYDLPWNPTRIMQRVGRINRVGSRHEKLYIFNIFPTSQADAHLGLESNIINKIDAFHTVLGEDDRYLSEEEQPVPQGLFGQRLMRRLDQAGMEEDNEEDSELKYLEIIRTIRDTEPELYSRLEHLPRKARAGREVKEHANSTLIFFKEGQVKKFVLVPPQGQGEPQELTFLEAATSFACPATTPRKEVPPTHYVSFSSARRWLEQRGAEDAFTPTRSTTDKQLLHGLKALLQWRAFQEEDRTYLALLCAAVDQGRLSRSLLKKLHATANPRKYAPQPMLAALRSLAPENMLTTPAAATPKASERQPHEIILAEYLVEN